MDKNRDMRRGGASRFSSANRQVIQQSGIDGNCEDSVFSKKLKKERMRRLSVVGKVNSSNENGEMGCAGSEFEDEIRNTTSISKRFKFPQNVFHECNTVDHASVPRKLRSAMKKRNRESISPPFPDKKETNHGTNVVELLGIKKSRLNQPEDPEGSPSRPITKDEEEVVETLHALADMFPNNNKNGLDGELEKSKSWPLPERESSRPACEDSAAPEKEEDSKSLCLSTTSEAEAVNPSLLEGLAQESVEVKCLKESSQPGFPNSTQLLTELDNTISQRNVQAMSPMSKSEPIDGKQGCCSVGCNVKSELSVETGSKPPKHEEAAACVRIPEIAVGKAAAVSSQHELHHTLKESKNSGSALWPGLSSAASNGDGTRRPSLKLSTPKIPAWLGMAASATQLGSLDNGVLNVKDSRALVARKKSSWKRCSAHVYICRLIKVLEIAEKTDRLPTQPTQLILNEGPSRVLSTPNNLNGVRNGLNGAVSAYNTVGSPAEKNPDEVRNANLLHTRLLQDQQQASTSLPLNSPQKQCYDFLSLSAGGGGGCGCGGGGMGATNRIDQTGGGLDPLTQFHSPYLQSLEQNHTIMQFSLPQNRFSSTPFTDHLSLAASKQVQIQQPPYLGSSLLGPPYLGNTASPKQQQQQRMWTAQLAAQYKPVGLAASHTPSWQNGRQDPSLAIQYVQSIPPPPSHYSLEVLGPRYAPISQQQLIGVTSSLPSSRYKGQYQVNGVGSYPDTVPPLQLLCNEHF